MGSESKPIYPAKFFAPTKNTGRAVQADFISFNQNEKKHRSSLPNVVAVRRERRRIIPAAGTGRDQTTVFATFQQLTPVGGL